ncbi:LacI family DNA-binding transcriptional regulator [Deminuibacter soli]|uniref:LacI family transcriptional regulator n=1 Tax=Deminuibacter soli TaxID=2291815 RepID=A0A3E1NNR0_9BACT|nr:substrate-binding domain-containing protein [Deminuibacter soli]RFM29464.1 LacI family transcriptional regulator [Deminuibacter soli]
MKKVSLKDIAQLAGVSPSTVSFVLNGKAQQMRITAAVAERVEQVARQQGYTPNQVAISLRTGETRILGLLVEDISNHFFATLARTIEAEAEKFGYKIVYCSTENNAGKGGELLRMLSQHQVDGFLITPSVGMEEDIMQLVQHKKPVVLIDRFFPGIDVPYVMVDNAQGVTEGMEFLLKKGYRKIGFVNVDLDLVQIHQRTDAYKQTLKEKQIPFKKEYLLQVPYPYQRQEAMSAINDFILKNKSLDAVFFATNYLGILGLESIVRAGLHIPKDIAMLCFDDHDIFRLYPEGIAIIQQPIEEIAETAIHLLMSELGKAKTRPAKRQVQLQTSLILRNSE